MTHRADAPLTARSYGAERQQKSRSFGTRYHPRVEVVAWDGEGFDEDLRHRYALLACAVGMADGSIVMGPELRKREGLRTLEMLDLMWRVMSPRPQALNVMYGASYDFDNWVKGVDYETAQAIRKGHPVLIGPFTFRSNGLWFELGRGHSTLIVWDMWRFWGTGFEAALRATFPDFAGLEAIRLFKERRGRFSWDMMDEVGRYNQLELVGLIMLTRQFFKDLGVAGIPTPSFLTGAGALAGALDRKFNVGRHVGDQRFGDPRIYDAVLRGFSAGRIDPWMIGHVPRGKGWEIKQHDLVSAYPSAMQHLPTLADGSWSWVDGEAPEDWNKRMSVWLVEWSYTDSPDDPKPLTKRYYPFFYRTRGGDVLYPPAGTGWQWWPEVITARKLGWRFKTIGGWLWEPKDTKVRPYSWVPMVFQQRRLLKEQHQEGAQRVLKYGLNALYGKMCQSRGSTKNRPPKFQNYAWAGWVTSHCRAQIMWAANQAPKSVLYQMTDSVVALEELDVPEGTWLGDWEIENRVEAVIAQAGVGSTWCAGCRDHPDGGEHKKYRGFDPDTIHAGAILAAWEENARLGWQHALTCQVRRPVTLAEAVLSEERYEEFGNWRDQTRDLDIYGGGGKRHNAIWRSMRPWELPCPLDPTPAWTSGEFGNVPMSAQEIAMWCVREDIDWMSAPYEPHWSETDPYALPEVMGRLRRVEDTARDQ